MMSPEHKPTPRYNMLFLRAGSPQSDFRFALASELSALGHDVTYVYLRRRPVIVPVADVAQQRSMSLPAFFLWVILRHGFGRDRVVFNSTNLAFPGLSVLLRIALRGKWIFDLHDDLTYGLSGTALTRASKLQLLLAWISHVTVCASPLLSEVVPGAIHLGNASNMQPVSRAMFDGRILIMASIDDRMDFALLSAVAKAAPDFRFEIRGHIVGESPVIRERLVALTAECSNVRYGGPYVNVEIDSLMRDFAVTFAPYRTEIKPTRYIDPLRFYHCLNSKMEVISTDIPAARDILTRLHIITNGEDFARTARNLRAEPGARRNAGTDQAVANWRERALKLIDIISGRTVASQASLGEANSMGHAAHR